MNIDVTAQFPREVQSPAFGVNIVTNTGLMVADCRSSYYGLKAGAIKGTVQYLRIDGLGLYPHLHR